MNLDCQSASKLVCLPARQAVCLPRDLHPALSLSQMENSLSLMIAPQSLGVRAWPLLGVIVYCHLESYGSFKGNAIH